MKRRLQMIILLWGCILMQVATVFPHHHHEEALCLYHDAETSAPANTSGRCSSECITHFNLTLPSSRPALHEGAGQAAYTDWILFLCGGFPFPTENGQVRLVAFDKPSFYESRPSGGTGLRAPPCGSVLI